MNYDDLSRAQLVAELQGKDDALAKSNGALVLEYKRLIGEVAGAQAELDAVSSKRGVSWGIYSKKDEVFKKACAEYQEWMASGETQRAAEARLKSAKEAVVMFSQPHLFAAKAALEAAGYNVKEPWQRYDY